MPTNANATLEARATSIARVKAVVKSGEKVFNAYMIFTPFVLNCWLVMGWLARLGCSLSALLLSIVTNGVSPHRVVGCTIGTKRKGVKFFFKFFFSWGVGAWVWARGCGRSGVGAWVGRWGRRDADGRARDMAGWMGIVAVGWTRSASLGFPIPDSDCRLACNG